MAVAENCLKLTRINCVNTRISAGCVEKYNTKNLKVITLNERSINEESDNSYTSGGFDDPEEQWKREDAEMKRKLYSDLSVLKMLPPDFHSQM